MKRKLDTTLLVIVKDNKILLATKKRGFGVGKYNGVGGKRQENETIYEAMVRETEEEIGVKPLNAINVGIIDFDMFLKGENVIEKMFIYIANDYSGEIIESEEMKPEWFDLDKIPYDNMFADDIIWLPEVLKGNKIQGQCVFDKDFNMLSHTIKPVDNLSI
ncbi:MAG: 8-oxo-dGTP diphosphatase [Clostridia bacterium]|nr:8-oxo-dGTP diphosphatase [Clostridia bacterium]